MQTRDPVVESTHRPDYDRVVNTCGAKPAFYNTVGVVAIAAAVAIGYGLYSFVAR